MPKLTFFSAMKINLTRDSFNKSPFSKQGNIKSGWQNFHME